MKNSILYFDLKGLDIEYLFKAEFPDTTISKHCKGEEPINYVVNKSGNVKITAKGTYIGESKDNISKGDTTKYSSGTFNINVSVTDLKAGTFQFVNISTNEQITASYHNCFVGDTIKVEFSPKAEYAQVPFEITAEPKGAMKDAPVEQIEKVLDDFFDSKVAEEFMNAVDTEMRTYIDDLDKPLGLKRDFQPFS